jgi:hypothetical protein
MSIVKLIRIVFGITVSDQFTHQIEHEIGILAAQKANGFINVEFQVQCGGSD